MTRYYYYTYLLFNASTRTELCVHLMTARADDISPAVLAVVAAVVALEAEERGS